MVTIADKIQPGIREIEARSLLNKSGLADYAVNCYAGCRHACVYCYARFATRFTHAGERWGTFVDVKVNAPQLLEREAARKKPGLVFLSSVCDGWQPLEQKYGLTRRCLEILLKYAFQLTVLTKSALVTRDFDLLAGKSGVSVGLTITTLDESLRRLIEPGGAPSDQRLAALEEAKRRGIRTGAFLGPLLPGLSDTEAGLTALLRGVREAGVDYFYVDRLNPHHGMWQDLKGLLERRWPHLVNDYRRVLFDPEARARYTQDFLRKVHRLAAQAGIEEKMTVCF
ncbi:MAG: radical SAM protein [Chloroflexi bacterium]|nr:radical SAM protein [Chloroflexota bacterium]